jgi:hypothetical protein
MKHILAVIALLALTYSAQAQGVVRPEYAIIKPSHVLPPEEFDFPFKGAIITYRPKDQTELRSICSPSPLRLRLAYPRRSGVPHDHCRR